MLVKNWISISRTSSGLFDVSSPPHPYPRAATLHARGGQAGVPSGARGLLRKTNRSGLPSGELGNLSATAPASTHFRRYRFLVGSCHICSDNASQDRGEEMWGVARLNTGYVRLNPNQYFR